MVKTGRVQQSMEMPEEEISQTKNGDFPLPWKTPRARFPHFHRYDGSCCPCSPKKAKPEKFLLVVRLNSGIRGRQTRLSKR
jgi:hypothetical protein